MTTTSITGVAVFDGERLLDGRFDVTFDESSITGVVPTGGAPIADVVVDGNGATVLPGLVDAHVHFSDPAQLAVLARHGVTTALDMGASSPEFVGVLRASRSGADVRSSGGALAGTGGPHARIPGFPAENLVTSPDEARARVEARLAEGADYLKLVLERPGGGGPDPATASAAVEAAHAAGLRVVAHASSVGAYRVGVQAGVDVLTHAPLDADLDADLLGAIAAAGIVVVPTLTMMQGTARNLGHPALSYAHARAAATALHRAGVAVVAGTDANDAPGVPASVPHGSSLHDEIELLVEAGLTPVEALRAATSAAADAFGLSDRGRLRTGLRADLVLVTGDPTGTAGATRTVSAVWVAGATVTVP